MNPRQERDLPHALRSGDRSAFETAVQSHYESVWRQHLLLAGDRELAADLTQETFVQAWLSIRTFQGRSSFRTWLHTIAVRVWQRHRARGQPTLGPVEHLDALPDRAPRPEQALDSSVRSESVLCAVQALPETQRAVIVLCYRQEMTLREAADALQIPLGTVKSRLHDALTFLRRRLATLPEEIR